MEVKLEIYQIGQVFVERNNLWDDLQKYIESEALNHHAHEVEEKLFAMLRAIGKNCMKGVFINYGTGKSSYQIVDKKGDMLPYHKVVTRQYQTIYGVIEIERAGYWKKGSAMVFPLDEHFNLPEKRYSYLLEKWVQDGVADAPYDEVIQRIENIFKIGLCKRGQEILSREVSKNVDVFYNDHPHPTDITEGSIIVATSDCKGVVMVPRERSEQAQCKSICDMKARDGRGRKGLKRDAVVTADYTYNPEVRTPEEVLELLMRSDTKEQHKAKKNKKKEEQLLGRPKIGVAINKRVMASLEGKSSAFEDLADRITQRDPLGQKNIFLQIDGAKSLEKGLLKTFKARGWLDRIVGVALDIIHVMEYVWELSTSLHGNSGEERVKWVKKQALAILQGKVGYVIGGLKQILTKGEKLRTAQKKVLKKVITYFDNHKHMMKYDEYLAMGLPIATGIIEGACGSLVKDRMERSGMKWTHYGAQAVLNLRALKRNGDWDKYWEFHIVNEHERLYGNFEKHIAA